MSYAGKLVKAHRRAERERRDRIQQVNVEYGLNRKVPARKDMNKPDYKSRPYTTPDDKLQRIYAKVYGLEKP